MSVWAHECRSCADPGQTWFVACDRAADFPSDTRIVQVRVGRRWLCAELDRSRRVQVEGMLVREAVPTDASDCEACRDA